LRSIREAKQPIIKSIRHTSKKHPRHNELSLREELPMRIPPETPLN